VAERSEADERLPDEFIDSLSICHREFTVYSAYFFVGSFVINILSYEEFQFETDYREYCEMKL
jgi:hypothetical protein